MEDRVWHWINYAATRVARGELFEAAYILDVLRIRILGPLAQAETGVDAFGVKDFERLNQKRAAQLQAIQCRYATNTSCIRPFGQLLTYTDRSGTPRRYQ